MNNLPQCPGCGTWVCNDCGARRQYASRFSAKPHNCPRCRGRTGQMLPVRHQQSRAEDHLEIFHRISDEGRIPRYPLQASRAADA